MKTTSNIDQLVAHLQKKFKGMMKSQELADAGKRASKVMGDYAYTEASNGGSTSYNYEQSGEFISLIEDEARHGSIHQTPSTMSIGFGYIPNFSDKGSYGAMRNFQLQEHVFNSNGATRIKTFRLKQENQMPKWIIAEFGSGRRGEGMGSIPQQFRVNYTKRPGKDFLYGPSVGKVRGEGGGSKKGYFQVSGEKLSKLTGSDSLTTARVHPGVKPGRIFRNALKRSKTEVKNIISDGIRDYLNN